MAEDGGDRDILVRLNAASGQPVTKHVIVAGITMHDAKTQRIACRLALQRNLAQRRANFGRIAQCAVRRDPFGQIGFEVMALPFSPSTNGAAKGWAGRPRPNVVAMAKGATICAASV
jgi:hypothetical protein